MLITSYLDLVQEELRGDDLPLVQPGLAVGLEDSPAEERLVRCLEVRALAEVQRHAEVDVPDHVRPTYVKENHVPYGISEYRACIPVKPHRLTQVRSKYNR
jgi:hypothetical protein